MDDPVITSLTEAVAARPDDLALRRHLAQLLVERGRGSEAVVHLAVVLAGAPDDTVALDLMSRALGGPAAVAPNPSDESPVQFDWAAADEQMSDVVPAAFVEADETADRIAYPEVMRTSRLRLADVGGMKEVKERIEISFLMPMRNPQLRSAFGKSLRGGLLLYGPPGCGKTYLARAVAGELDASFIAVTLSDVLDMWLGNSEKNVHEIFVAARQAAPCVLFLDEVDALALKRSQHRGAGRNVVNQLLQELDGVGSDNEGVFVLGATNHPWDVDEALVRPGRLDRMLAVLPPDPEAREAIFRHHLEDRPVAGIDLAQLAARTDGYTGADIALICEGAAEKAMVDSYRSGEVRMIGMADLLAAVTEVKPSSGPWLQTARTVAEFANSSGQYDDLKAYLKQRRLL